MKRLIFPLMMLMAVLPITAQEYANQTEVMAWGNITGIRVDGELIDFETSLVVGDRHSGKERYGTQYEHRGHMQQVRTEIERVQFTEQVTDLGRGLCEIHLDLSSDVTEDKVAGICLHLDAQRYAQAKIKTSSKALSIVLKEGETVVRDIRLAISQKTKPTVSRNDHEILVMIPVMPTLVKGDKATMDIKLTATGVIDHTDAIIDLDTSEPGRQFVGVGGNFRLQNPSADPAIIDYCLENMRVAFGRVEMPWRDWQPEEDVSLASCRPEDLPKHVRESMEMACRLQRMGMPVIVSCWFPPQWALEKGSSRRRGGVAALRLDASKEKQVLSSLTDYLCYLKSHYGVEAAMFSFNESDIGIDVLHTPEEHAAFIKAMGRTLVERGLATKMLLGDTSDANPTHFVGPALEDRDTWPYIGAVSFHSWRGCSDEKLRIWADVSRRLGVPLLVGEGSTDAAAWRYPQIFEESTFALYEINLYVRICHICQPQSILQWQLTSDYSLLSRGQGTWIPTQRFWNIKQLASTPEGSFSLPVTSSKPTLNCAAFGNIAKGEFCVHMVNNGASCKVRINGFPQSVKKIRMYVTHADAKMRESSVNLSGSAPCVELPPLSFVTFLATED